MSYQLNRTKLRSNSCVLEYRPIAAIFMRSTLDQSWRGIAVAGIVLLAICGNAAEQATVRIQGDLKYEVYGTEIVRNMPFSICVQTKPHYEWRIELHLNDESIETSSSDGEDVYVTLRAPSIEPYSPGIVLTGEQGFTAQVLPGPYPRVSSDHAKVIWLAYLAGPHLEGRESLLPPWPASKPISPNETSRLPEGELPISFSLSTKPPFVPLNLQYFLGHKVDNGTGSRTSPIAEYESSELQSYGGVTIPGKFELRRYLTKGQSATTEVFVRYSAQVSDISASRLKSLRPELPEKASVFDRRVAEASIGEQGMQGVFYTATNGVWLEKNDPVLLGIAAQEKQRYRQP